MAAIKKPADIRLMSKGEVLDRVGVSFPTLWRWMRADKFPRARDDGSGMMPVWLAHEVEAWILSRPLRTFKGDVGPEFGPPTAVPTPPKAKREKVVS